MKDKLKNNSETNTTSRTDTWPNIHSCRVWVKSPFFLFYFFYSGTSSKNYTSVLLLEFITSIFSWLLIIFLGLRYPGGTFVRQSGLRGAPFSQSVFVQNLNCFQSVRIPRDQSPSFEDEEVGTMGRVQLWRKQEAPPNNCGCSVNDVRSVSSHATALSASIRSGHFTW